MNIKKPQRSVRSLVRDLLRREVVRSYTPIYISTYMAQKPISISLLLSDSSQSKEFDIIK